MEIIILISLFILTIILFCFCIYIRVSIIGELNGAFKDFMADVILFYAIPIGFLITGNYILEKNNLLTKKKIECTIITESKIKCEGEFYENVQSN